MSHLADTITIDATSPDWIGFYSAASYVWNTSVRKIRIMLPDLESLRCFEAAARRLGFAAAAREVRLSPPAFSERIRRLEEQLGTALFQPRARRGTLTAAGSPLLPHLPHPLETAPPS